MLFVIICSKGDKLRLYSNTGALQGNFIKFTQGSLEEMDYEGKVVRKIKLNGDKDWSPVEQAAGIFP